MVSSLRVDVAVGTDDCYDNSNVADAMSTTTSDIDDEDQAAADIGEEDHNEYYGDAYSGAGGTYHRDADADLPHSADHVGCAVTAAADDNDKMDEDDDATARRPSPTIAAALDINDNDELRGNVEDHHGRSSSSPCADTGAAAECLDADMSLCDAIISNDAIVTSRDAAQHHDDPVVVVDAPTTLHSGEGDEKIIEDDNDILPFDVNAIITKTEKLQKMARSEMDRINYDLVGHWNEVSQFLQLPGRIKQRHLSDTHAMWCHTVLNIAVTYVILKLNFDTLSNYKFFCDLDNFLCKPCTPQSVKRTIQWIENYIATK